MFIGLSLPVFILGSLALALADYLWRMMSPPVLPTNPLSKPYTPPFTGGQCPVNYIVVYRQFETSMTGVESQRGGVGFQQQANLAGAISGGSMIYGVLTPLKGYLRIEWTIKHGNNQVYSVSVLSSVDGTNITSGRVEIVSVTRVDGQADSCGNLPNPLPPSGIGGNGLPSSPPPVLYPPPNSPPNTPPTTPNNNWFKILAGTAALLGAASAAAAGAGAAITAGAGAAAAAAAASASAPSGSTTQKQADSQKLSGDALVGIAQVLAEISKQIQELEKEIRKLKTEQSKKEKDDAKTIVRYDFGSANRDGFIKFYPESNLDSYEATFIDVQIFNIPSGSGRYFGDKSPHYYKYKSLGQVHFVSPTFGILESREIDFARLSLNVPDNCFGFFYHFGLDGIVSANLSCFYTKTEKQAV